ncbi:DinB family protein [Paenibacillus alginolyticus]|uniref:DinB family protein n=1 Tax=Paenibacillus alginolyticus TaxID=59839 RepID=A0ABT4GH37_9BACL|nr:DinB family protein [Paenibacillus alginolyticus]MCY9695501.1 DinB family protein [Paenibacillus alginolyticus]MEC0146622.1 DinB family protein [Paenibacillus alginolyticus]
MLQRPDSEEYSPYFTGYINQVPEGDYLSILHIQLDAIVDLFSPINNEQGLYRYEPGKWSLKEVLGHITDTERIMSYRMLRIARGDTTNLPGFDQDLYITNTSFDELSMEDLLNDFKAVRQATFTLLKTISEAAWLRKGIANNNEISARALAFVIAGHAQHHLGVIQQKYND